MGRTLDDRVTRLERSGRRSRLGLLALGGVLGAAVMLGAQGQNEPRIDGFTAVMDQAGGLTYFRLVDGEYVQVLDQTRGDRWFWRRIRNWPDHK